MNALQNYTSVDREAAREYVGEHRLTVLSILTQIRNSPKHMCSGSGICFGLYEALKTEGIATISAYWFMSIATGMVDEADDEGGSYPIDRSDDCGYWEGEQLEARLQLLDELIEALV